MLTELQNFDENIIDARLLFELKACTVRGNNIDKDILLLNLKSSEVLADRDELVDASYSQAKRIGECLDKISAKFSLITDKILDMANRDAEKFCELYSSLK